MDNLQQPVETVVITDTNDRSFSFLTQLQRFFAQDSDPADSEYCFATLFTTRFGLPIRPIASYRLKKKDRNHQTYYGWEFSGIFTPKPKNIPAQKVELREDQVRWVKMTYWYIPLALLAGDLLIEAFKFVRQVFLS